MEKAVARLNSAIGTNPAPPSSELGGEFQITDLKTNEQGTLEICMEGVNLTFKDQKVFDSVQKIFGIKILGIIFFINRRNLLN